MVTVICSGTGYVAQWKHVNSKLGSDYRMTRVKKNTTAQNKYGVLIVHLYLQLQQIDLQSCVIFKKFLLMQYA